MNLKNGILSTEIEYYQGKRNIKKKILKAFQNAIINLKKNNTLYICKLERILIKTYKQNVSLLLNDTYLNERLLPNYTHTYI